MTNPEQHETDSESEDGQPLEVPPAAPAYGTPPPEGIPDAEHD